MVRSLDDRTFQPRSKRPRRRVPSPSRRHPSATEPVMLAWPRRPTPRRSSTCPSKRDLHIQYYTVLHFDILGNPMSKYRNVGGLVFVCIEAEFLQTHKYLHSWKRFFRSARFAHFCTAPNSNVLQKLTILSPQFSYSICRSRIATFDKVSINLRSTAGRFCL